MKYSRKREDGKKGKEILLTFVISPMQFETCIVSVSEQLLGQ